MKEKTVAEYEAMGRRLAKASRRTGADLLAMPDAPAMPDAVDGIPNDLVLQAFRIVALAGATKITFADKHRLLSLLNMFRPIGIPMPRPDGKPHFDCVVLEVENA